MPTLTEEGREPQRKFSVPCRQVFHMSQFYYTNIGGRWQSVHYVEVRSSIDSVKMAMRPQLLIIN